MDQVPLASLEASTDPHQDFGKGKEAKTLQGKDKGKDKKKDSSNPAEKASDIAISQLEQAAYTLGIEETQARLIEEFSTVCRDYCDIS